jgi:plasmid stabilization system protein ParE
MLGKNKKINVVFSPKAEKSLFLIAFYIGVKGYPNNAVNFYQRLIEFGDSLGNMPEKHNLCRHKIFAKHKYRCAVYKSSYVFIYKITDKSVIIMNIIHSSFLQ